MAKKPIRFGIIGCADIARKVSRAVAFTEPFAVASRSSKKAPAFAEANNLPTRSFKLTMTHLHKLKILRWVSSNFVGRHHKPSSSVRSLIYITKKPRFFSTQGAVLIENEQSINSISDAARKEAQAALLEHLHYTRNLQFTAAENMSKNSPHFIEKLLATVDIDTDIGQSVTRFLRFNPINEFEPFFESLGLKPHEYSPLLRRDLMFLCDDELLLGNYYVLCNYGVARNKIGMIYKEAIEIFRYGYGVLLLKLKAYEDLGLRQSFVIKLLVCSPYLFIGEVNSDFIKVLKILRKAGVKINRIEEHLSEKGFYDWSKLLALLNLFRHIGYNDEQLGGMMSQHPGLWFGDSVDRIYLLIGFLLKFGSTINQVCSIFLQFPQLEFEKFVSNLRRCFLFLNEIKMDSHEIGNLFRENPVILGSFRLKKAHTLLRTLKARKKRVREIIQENPQVLKKWVVGSKVEEFPNPQMLKTKFLLDLGIVENSNKIENALKDFKCSGAEIQERFDCLVKAGFDRKDACEMIKRSPKILELRKDILEMKIGFLVNNVGYPISSLVSFPFCLSYTIERVKLRVAMYNWLKDQGKLVLILSLSTLIALPNKRFISEYVNRHPKGLEIWQDLKKEIYGE